MTDSHTASLRPNKSHILNNIRHVLLWGRGRLRVDRGGLWKKRAGREGKAPQMKILNQHALPLQLRPRRGLHLIYSPKPGNQAIKRNQTIRFPALNGPVVWCGQLRIQLNPFEVAGERLRQRPSFSRPVYLLTLRLQLQRRLGSVLVDCSWHIWDEWNSLPVFGRCWISVL